MVKKTAVEKLAEDTLRRRKNADIKRKKYLKKLDKEQKAREREERYAYKGDGSGY